MKVREREWTREMRKGLIERDQVKGMGKERKVNMIYGMGKGTE